ncbi:MAG TPA: thioesterase family protein [Pseudolysinimonas sp.]|nr:thioesterase family protein [Pseudolysinimonas sp.]
MDPIRRYLRLLRIVLGARRGPRLGIHDVGITRERVWLTDLDELRHMNNSVYLALMDHSRLDLLLRSGAWKALRGAGVYPVVGVQTIAYRKSLELGQRFTIETRIAGYDERAVYIEQRFVRDGEITAVAYAAGRMLRDSGGVVTTAELGEVVGVDVSARPVPQWLSEWARATRLPGTKSPAPNIWPPSPTE